jgi:hypothetical protein
MRSLKSINDEKNRESQITHIVNQIYTNAIDLAGVGTKTEYHQFGIGEFHRENMDEILERVRNLFEGCKVFYRNMYLGQDGKYYDVSSWNTAILPYDTKGKNIESIMVDWS